MSDFKCLVKSVTNNGGGGGAGEVGGFKSTRRLFCSCAKLSYSWCLETSSLVDSATAGPTFGPVITTGVMRRLARGGAVDPRTSKLELEDTAEMEVRVRLLVQSPKLKTLARRSRGAGGPSPDAPPPRNETKRTEASGGSGAPVLFERPLTHRKRE